MRPLSSEWPLWSEVGTILPLKTLALSASCSGRNNASFFRLLHLLHLLPPAFFSKKPDQRVKPPLWSALFGILSCCSLVRLEIKVESLGLSARVCVKCVCGGGTVCCATVMPVKHVRKVVAHSVWGKLALCRSPICAGVCVCRWGEGTDLLTCFASLLSCAIVEAESNRCWPAQIMSPETARNKAQSSQSALLLSPCSPFSAFYKSQTIISKKTNKQYVYVDID